MNSFVDYGAQNVRQKEQKPKGTLELKMEEKRRLSRAYRRVVAAERRATFEAEPRLRDFMRYLRSVGAEQADELIDAIASSWLPRSGQAVRLLALRLVERRCDRLNRNAGFEALDDPIPPKTSTYFRVRDLLHGGGRA